MKSFKHAKRDAHYMPLKDLDPLKLSHGIIEYKLHEDTDDSADEIGSPSRDLAEESKTKKMAGKELLKEMMSTRQRVKIQKSNGLSAFVKVSGDTTFVDFAGCAINKNWIGTYNEDL